MGMEKPKSKGIFWILSIVAVIFLVLFSFSVGAGSIPMMILTFILFIATFGAGFTLKKKYRENNWL
jgi:flagellar basal body-associated protein FliL